MLNIRLPSLQQIINQFLADFNILDGNFVHKNTFVLSAKPNPLTENGRQDGWELRIATVYSVFDADLDAQQYVIWCSSVDTSTMDITIDDEPYEDGICDTLEEAIKYLHENTEAFKIY
ncbi:hypothetical protein KARL1_243 [Acinetobacter phage KARL-1]|uniref:Uncharacterized protein n=1 Tax=Acinetobacter phage KARL-1 TaxID=2301662 RepID=A0A385IJ06_9CAUD|nr:hypothetical protein HYP70_gp243 [Acinetobacter phage KARL-1]AXY82862.1 hypothetical protein KARL1_243 [Acinetobacter phage KARL-1]